MVGEIYMVHMSAWGHCRDAVCGVKVMRPGKYLAMVSIPVQYVCHRMIFRCYSTRPLAMKPITQHRAWVAVNPSMPLDAMPYHLAGFMRVDAYSEKLPQMFDEAEGRGKPMANDLGGYINRSPAWKGWRQELKRDLQKIGPKREDGLKVVGKFGGQDAVASVEASESQAVNCSVM